MELYTTTIRLHKAVKQTGLITLNTTRKTGDVTFAPSWPLLTRYLSGAITEDEYLTDYLTEMRLSYHGDTARWVEIATVKDPIAIYCYCGHGKFCHRRILVSMFAKVCERHSIDFNYCGEIIDVKDQQLITQPIDPIQLP